MDVAAHKLYVEFASNLVPLAPADLAASELTGRVLEGTPTDDALLAAIDVLLLTGSVRDAWPVVLRALWNRLRGDARLTGRRQAAQQQQDALVADPF